jgi:hypothetical protein
MFSFDGHATFWLAIGMIIGCGLSWVAVVRMRRRQMDQKTEQLQKEIDLWAYRSLSQEAAAQKARTELHANVSATMELRHKLSALEQQHSVLKSNLDRHRTLLDYAVSAYAELRHQHPEGGAESPPHTQETPGAEQDRIAAP